VTVWIAEAPGGQQLADEIGKASPGVQVRSFAGPAGVKPLISAVVGGTLVLSARSGLLGLKAWWRDLAAARCTVLFLPESPPVARDNRSF
jgi:hypothetical protein